MVGTRLAVLLLIVATPLTAQTVRGQLTDSLTRSPLPGAFLTLVDEQGVERARSITNAAGEFLITAPAAGTYRLRSKRIGFRPYVSTALVLGAGETSALNAAVDPIAVVLSEVVVVGERQCNVASGGQGGASVGAVWEEIREALAAVAWTSRLPNYWYDIAHFQRELTATARRQAGRPDSVWRNIGYQAVSFQSAPPEELEARGFVVPDAEGGWTYWGPDAEALMSPPFLRSHCFETVTGRDELTGLIGLAFTPARGRRVSDIQGTLWIDKQSAELRQIDYSYTRLPGDLVAPRAGGHIEFLRLPSGTWIVRDWAIRMPRAVEKQRIMGMGTQLEVAGYREAGGNLVEVKTRTGMIVYHSDSLAAALAAMTPAPAVAGETSPTVPAPVTFVAIPPAPASDSDAGSPAAPAMASGGGGGQGTAVRTPSLIAPADVLSSSAIDAYALIQELRPSWLRSHGTISIRDPSTGDVQVFLNGQQLGDVSRLREIAKREIREVKFYNPGQAHLRFGMGHAGGVIDVATGATTPSRPPPPPAATEPDTAAAPAPPASEPPRRLSPRNQGVLQPEEFEGTTAADVLALVQEFRPNWLRGRGTTSIYDPNAGDVKVYVNGVWAGDVNRLHDFRVGEVRELRFLNAGDAQQRYGSGNGGGVIEIVLK